MTGLGRCLCLTLFIPQIALGDGGNACRAYASRAMSLVEAAARSGCASGRTRHSPREADFAAACMTWDSPGQAAADLDERASALAACQASRPPERPATRGACHRCGPGF